ncbi:MULTISPECIES: hypothetical protein [unclassified Janthinobacterium]|uniref:hypothetical protein n=1 Tax=unclassified Janthinobacterium TaxID=2610881 RepID=UPI00162251AC|nr:MULTISPECIES: hypothetical protein [unclassified Janthinobacterium]MBB5368332.1 glutamine synthetase adenylyltransferase [Janthinobacterium sp. K2C7]MBB5382132.1 glutamine synthetase adenylyltransferase [Janthinobacterium sp. K2Li3]MBB5386714.1 glutamine synthetase adenylyltransferase [Janthinobacterium sp. K2E3]
MILQLEFIEQRRVPWLGLLFLAISLGGAGVALTESLALREAASSHVQRASQLEQALQERRRSILQQQAKNDPEKQRQQKEQAKIIATLRYPWTRVMASIEQADANDVAMLSLSHEQTTGLTQITLEALDTQALVRFVDALNEGGDDGGDVGTQNKPWYIASYQLQPQNNPQTVKGVVLSR